MNTPDVDRTAPLCSVCGRHLHTDNKWGECFGPDDDPNCFQIGYVRLKRELQRRDSGSLAAIHEADHAAHTADVEQTQAAVAAMKEERDDVQL